MKISLQQLAKRYNKEWIFKGLTYEFKPSNSYAIVGANGSGKSTLLQIISGYQIASSGKLIYSDHHDEIAAEEIYRHISIATPYMELIEEFTLLEHLKFHFKFRQLRQDFTVDRIIESCYLQNARHKNIRNFSSGMKQRLKLAVACYTQSSLILLDEPTSNLDSQGVEWYQERLRELTQTDATIIIASNQSYEYEEFCTDYINLHDYKK